MDAIINCELKPSETASKEIYSFKGLSCTKTNLKCYFQGSNCTEIKKKEEMTLYLDEMWNYDKVKINKSCDTKIKLNITGYFAEKAFWNLTCDKLKSRNRTELPRAYIYACTQNWYNKKFVHYGENICDLDCKEPMIQCNVYWGTICVDSIQECNFLHGDKKEKTMVLMTATTPNAQISLKSLNLFIKVNT
nr:uncharacterized protein LOC121122154 [Lepeophtheirus salmonis]